MKYFIYFLLLVAGFYSQSIAQSDTEPQSIEVFLIDSYVTQETPHKFVVSYFTSDSCTSELVINKKYSFIVSDVLTDNHKTEIELTNLVFDTTFFNFRIFLKDKNGEESQSELYEVTLPQGYDIKNSRNTNYLVLCCFGGIIFGLPSPALVLTGEEKYFSLSKEIPVLSFYGQGYNYPSGYLGIEYSYVFKAPSKSYLRIGYKHIFQIPVLEYVSPGVNAATDFKGFNGVSPELSIGWFKLYNVFTLYTKYRFNFKPGDFDNNFHEISLGLYSHFFSINL